MTESAKDKLLNALRLAAAGALVLERWIWDQGKASLQSLARHGDYAKAAGAIRDSLAPLPPAATLAAFFAPIALALVFTDKMLGAIFGGFALPGLVLLFVVQAILVAVAGYIFDLTRTKLVSVAWFAALAESAARIVAEAEAYIEPIWTPKRAAISGFRGTAEAFIETQKPAFLRTLENLRAMIAPKTKTI